MQNTISTKPDCLTCGACCVSPFDGEGYIQLDENEEKRLGGMGLPVLEILPDPDDRVVLLGTKRNVQGVRVCAALRGRVAGEVACAIYAERPALCRQFEAGSPECHAARQAAGINS